SAWSSDVWSSDLQVAYALCSMPATCTRSGCPQPARTSWTPARCCASEPRAWGTRSARRRNSSRATSAALGDWIMAAVVCKERAALISRVKLERSSPNPNPNPIRRKSGSGSGSDLESWNRLGPRVSCTLVLPPMPPDAGSLPPIPDLLSAAPMVRVDLAALRQTLVFAFAMDGSVESFEDALARAALPASGWDRQHFQRDLFLSELIERFLPVRALGRTYRPAAGYLLRTIAEPPRAPEVVAFRRKVLEELATSEGLRRELEVVYAEIVGLRGLLCAGQAGVRWLRRLEILKAVHHVFATLAGSFE